MHVGDIFKHKHNHKDEDDKQKPIGSPKEKHHHSDRKEEEAGLPKGFVNDAMRTSRKPDTLYGFDDPLARRLGPVPSEDPTNTGA
ncbi:hypothetical protein G6F57_009001 [Rhizopus arrhizus]|uniref:Uncharacterized protein n=1 Tax=Rhizopus oryzae TaxID=64495 RepID=A0A9P7BP98_RHIOR|nr:hypothetical protein G6F23_009947 [Rhizopus arrhizus]KAG1415452.1 hypothetical protein G6F58_006472 [Rhizopus delemar]KAG0758732.1 hypothetical protein G6F24_009588 [Rhizopus arrhizus]KAG0769872.1 hypothetical protein G6F22_017300 [Rhizopus arrhizus]KAG0787119.1 hypothetical protein G6F21_008123 [Rhizopus arrhizus]